jgi:hypothetical protein
MRKNEYKAKFDYGGHSVAVSAIYNAGQSGSYWEPEESPHFESQYIEIDKIDVSNLDDDSIAEILGIKYFQEFWIAAEECLFSTNEHLLLGYDPDFDPE